MDETQTHKGSAEANKKDDDEEDPNRIKMEVRQEEEHGGPIQAVESSSSATTVEQKSTLDDGVGVDPLPTEADQGEDGEVKSEVDPETPQKKTPGYNNSNYFCKELAELENLKRDTNAHGDGQGDEEDRKLFVGGLSRNTDEREIVTHFAEFGVIEDFTLKMDPMTGQSRGFCFIVFETQEATRSALSAHRHMLGGRVLAVKRAQAKQGKVHLGKLPREVDEAAIREVLSDYGNIVSIEHPFDRMKNEKRNFCFVTFDREGPAKTLLKERSVFIKDHEIQVNKVNPKVGDAKAGGAMAMGRMGGRASMAWGGFGASYAQAQGMAMGGGVWGGGGGGGYDASWGYEGGGGGAGGYRNAGGYGDYWGYNPDAYYYRSSTAGTAPSAATAAATSSPAAAGGGGWVSYGGGWGPYDDHSASSSCGGKTPTRGFSGRGGGMGSTTSMRGQRHQPY